MVLTPESLDYLTIYFTDHSGKTVVSFNINANLGRYYIDDYIPEYILNYANDKDLKVFLSVPPNYFCYLYLDACQSSSSVVLDSRAIGTYFESVSGSKNRNVINITSIFSSNKTTKSAIDVHRYSNQTFVANCANSNNGSESPINYGGVSPDICQELYDNSIYREKYPVSMVGKPPQIPEPTFFSGCSDDFGQWTWLWIVAIVVGIVLIMIIISIIVRYTSDNHNVKRETIKPKKNYFEEDSYPD